MSPFRDSIDAPLLVELLDYWTSKKGDRFAPARADIDPAEIRHLLPHLLLTEVIDGGARFRYRLAGTSVESHFGCPMAGRFIDELMRGSYAAYVVGLYHELLTSRRPIYSESAYGGDASPFSTKRLMLPLSSDGAEIDMVLAGQVFTRRRAIDERTVLLVQEQFSDMSRKPVSASGG